MIFRFLFLLFCVTFSFMFGSGGYAWDDMTDWSYWVQDYYQHPEPEKLLEAQAFYYKSGDAGSHNFANVAAFLGTAAAEDGTIFNEKDFSFQLSGLTEWEKLNFYLMLHFSGFSENQILKDKLLRKEEEAFQKVYYKMEAFLQNPDKIHMYLELRKKDEPLFALAHRDFWPWQFDIHWSFFFATGNTEYIDAILQMMNEISKTKGKHLLMVVSHLKGGQFGLIGNARQDDKVFHYLKTLSVQEFTPYMQGLVANVLERAKSLREKDEKKAE